MHRIASRGRGSMRAGVRAFNRAGVRACDRACMPVSKGTGKHGRGAWAGAFHSLTASDFARFRFCRRAVPRPSARRRRLATRAQRLSELLGGANFCKAQVPFARRSVMSLCRCTETFGAFLWRCGGLHSTCLKICVWFMHAKAQTASLMLPYRSGALLLIAEASSLKRFLRMKTALPEPI